MFQFLIGTLKTNNLLQEVSDENRFQFLIGTLKTIAPLMIVKDKVMFQFLIGTLKTKCIFVGPTFFFFVSIPYRYA